MVENYCRQGVGSILEDASLLIQFWKFSFFSIDAVFIASYFVNVNWQLYPEYNMKQTYAASLLHSSSAKVSLPAATLKMNRALTCCAAPITVRWDPWPSTKNRAVVPLT